jgi:hypothetical protein
LRNADSEEREQRKRNQRLESQLASLDGKLAEKDRVIASLRSQLQRERARDDDDDDDGADASAAGTAATAARSRHHRHHRRHYREEYGAAPYPWQPQTVPLSHHLGGGSSRAAPIHEPRGRYGCHGRQCAILLVVALCGHSQLRSVSTGAVLVVQTCNRSQQPA